MDDEKDAEEIDDRGLNYDEFEGQVWQLGCRIFECCDPQLEGELLALIDDMRNSDAFGIGELYEVLEGAWDTDPAIAVQGVLEVITKRVKERFTEQMGPGSAIPWEMVGCSLSMRRNLISLVELLRATRDRQVIDELIAAVRLPETPRGNEQLHAP